MPNEEAANTNFTIIISFLYFIKYKMKLNRKWKHKGIQRNLVLLHFTPSTTKAQIYICWKSNLLVDPKILYNTQHA